ncbi:AraC family transcriptional regulator ligand-binding domain-containing protein [Gilvimarinus sp. F26214L]|uniref:AraC family transcriptional regulator ligand-binding domain-containing protein n=1 Tax=Gilvimarinus sp. DZF01 TaxID=3461371 RepID=UPI00404579F0
MNWTDKVIPFHFHPLGFIDSFNQYGASTRDLLAGAGIHGAILDVPEGKISYRQFVELLRSGIRLCNQPGLGLLIGRHFDWYYYGLPGIAMQASGSFKEATSILHRYTCLVQPYYGYFKSRPAFFVDNQQSVTIPIQYLLSEGLGDEKLQQFELEYRVGLLMRLLEYFKCSTEHSNVDVHLATPQPVHGHLYKELNGYQFHFNSKASRFILPGQVLASSRKHPRRGVFDHVLRYCRMELNQMDKWARYGERVRGILYENIPFYLNQKEVAERLGVTTRTLARKLQQEGTSFTEVLNDVRREIATYFLDSTQLSVADIAESMGFSDTTNFRQAFKRWTGQSASRTRETSLA